jgi:LmbE family N-acetylglucosaminyl deacetylase
MWVVFCSSAVRRPEAQASARAFLRGMDRSQVVIHEFRDAFLPWSGPAVKEAFEALKQAFAPDVIFTHYRDDRHQDHRLVSDLTWNTWRDHAILEYEIPKYDGDMSNPNVFVHLDEALCRRKIANILGSFPSQADKRWFTEDLFRAILRLRGMESNSPSGYAEAFHCRKAVLT